jgi:pimeloyl-ACP methyl ester carboxylesterase
MGGHPRLSVCDDHLSRSARQAAVRRAFSRGLTFHGGSALMAVTMSEAPKVNVISASVFSKAQLRAVRAPTLLLIGEKERLYEPHATLKLAQERMPGLTGAIVPGADHIAAMAQPDDINERIIRFLQQSAGGIGAAAEPSRVSSSRSS